MKSEFILIGVASDGSVGQWDGLDTTEGIFLRWFHGSLGFPEFGYDVWRAKITDLNGIEWDRLADLIAGRESYKGPDGLVLTCRKGFQFFGYQGHAGLEITSLNPVAITFPGPAWFLSIKMAPIQGNSISVKLFADGSLRETRLLTAANPLEVWRTRGIDRVELDGQGVCTELRYQLISSITGWQLMHHACLPVTDPAYAGGAGWSWTDEEEARRRLPPKADWTGRYGPAFKELYDYLRMIATGKTLPILPPAPQTGLETPSLKLNVSEAIETAMLNPHVARMLGTAWDDPLGGHLDGLSYAYKVVGTWLGALHRWLFRSPKVLAALAENGVRLSVPPKHVIDRSGLKLSLPALGSMDITVERPCSFLSLMLASTQDLKWQTTDIRGRLLNRGVFPASKKTAELKVPGDRLYQLQLYGPADLHITQLRLQDPPVERTALLPCVVAKEPGAPLGPRQLYSKILQSGNAVRSMEAHLHWDLPLNPSGATPGAEAVFFQLAGLQVGNEPDQPLPTPPGFSEKNFLDKDRLLVIPPAAADEEPCYFIDRPLDEGWRCWWARGVDMFGRVSLPSAPGLAQIADNARPPAPSLLLAEYVQDGLSAGQQGLAGYSAFGRSWLEAHPGESALVVGWGWTPELALDWPDVDGFQVHVRRPQPAPYQNPNDPAAAYSDDPSSWGPARAELAPLATCLGGEVSKVWAGIPQVYLTTVEIVDADHTVYQTDISLDLGRGALLGAALMADDGRAVGKIVGHGEGPGILITLEHPEEQSPESGKYALAGNDGSLFTLETDIQAAPLGPDPFCRRIGGVLVRGEQRWAVLYQESGRFLCLGSGPPVKGSEVSWLPAYLMAIPDRNFGPDPAGLGVPVAYAQVAVRSVRRWKQRELVSEFSRPGTLSAVDCSRPNPPQVEDLPCGPFCAQLASRADWYGISRFTLSWDTRPGETYQVYRALNEAVFALDRKAYGEGPGAGAHPFPNDPGRVWPTGIYSQILADDNRKKLVQDDFTLLDAALRSGKDEDIRNTYRKLHADTQRLLAGQFCVESAYSLRHGHPLTPGQVPFTDEFDGRSRAHWFYRVTALSASGVESDKTEPTPPICCPDVVPPSAPQVQMALAAEGAVRLQWLRSPEPDVAAYRIYRSGDESAAADVRDMQEVARVTAPSVVPGHPTWREYADPAPGGKDWFYRIVAEDDSGNRSRASEILRGRALLAPPPPPVWNPPARVPGTNPEKVQLSWTHPTDQRLACLVERRPGGGSLWTSVSSWLPRGLYQFEDTLPESEAAWEYRLRVRDHYGQTAMEMPILLLTVNP